MPTRKNRAFKKQPTLKNNYKHNLYANSYISKAFANMMEGSSKKEQETYLYYLVRYCFPDISLKKSHELAIILLDAIENSHTDHEICDLIYDYCKSLGTKNRIGYPISHEEYLKMKISEIEQIITPSLLEKQKHRVILDIGSGDCSITSMFGSHAKMTPVGVDVKDEMDWSSGKGSLCDKLTHIYYDGTNLVKAVRNEIGDTKIGIIMYNHSLHHFGNFENIKRSLKQAHTLLSSDGVLFVREHDKSQANDIDINLQHIFISMRYRIDQHNQTKDDLWNYMKYYIKTYTSHFFSKTWFIQLCKSIGFKLLKTDKKQVTMPYKNYREISKTTFYSFTKK